MLSETGVVVISAVVILVGFLSFTIGLFVRRSSDQELISELESELDRRQLVRPQEIAHEPSPLPPGARLVSSSPARAGTDDTQWDMTPVPAGDLEIWTARLTASNELFLAGLFE